MQDAQIVHSFNNSSMPYVQTFQGWNIFNVSVVSCSNSSIDLITIYIHTIYRDFFFQLLICKNRKLHFFFFFFFFFFLVKLRKTGIPL